MDIEKALSGKMDLSQSPYAEWYQNSLRVEGSPTHQYHARTYGAGFRHEQFAPQFNEQIRQWNPDAGQTSCPRRSPVCGPGHQSTTTAS